MRVNQHKRYGGLSIKICWFSNGGYLSNLNRFLSNQWDVDRYQSQHNFVWQYGTSLIELVNAQSNEKILDVGCGSGELAIALSMSADRVEVVGMDSDANMVARCREQYPHLRFFQGDVRNFQVNETFDVLFSNAALHWVPPADIHRAVASMARALKPGGRFVVEFGGKGNCEMILKATQEVLQTDLNPWYFPSIPEFGSLLEREGIEVTCASLFDRPTPLQEGEKGLVNWLLMFGGAFLREMTPSQREEKLNRIGEKLRDELWDGKQWIADYRRIRIIGKRM